MLNEFAIRNTNFNQKQTEKNSTIDKLKEIGSDSIFYFGIFLLAFFVLKSIPFLGGLLNESNLGINEVVVSFIGLVNVFFLQVFNKLFTKVQ
jgi:hypothetical protein